MKKALLLIAFVFAVAPAAAGQGYLYNCAGDPFKGPVRAVRVERAEFKKVDGAWVEGPRRLISETAYSDDRRRAEHTAYDDEGKVSGTYVRTCYENGKQAELAHYDDRQRLKRRRVFNPDGGEVLDLDAEGRLLRRETFERDGAGVLVAHRTFDGDGKLVREELHAREGKTYVQKTFDGEGRLLAKTVNSVNPDGRGGREEHRYKADGSIGVVLRATADAGLRQIEHTQEVVGTGRGRRLSDRREYDARGNLVKLTAYMPNAATGETAPIHVSYYEITYF
jgi:antitoxin component YwqK of YwqJK toxin-antitoxin module